MSKHGLIVAFFLSVMFFASMSHAQSALTSEAGPVDPTCRYAAKVCFRDDFASGGYTAGTVGELGWTIVNGTVTGVASESNRLGILRRDTGSTINTATAMYPRGLASIGTVNSAQLFTEVWHVRLGQAVGTFDFRAGLGKSTTGDPPADGIYFEVLAADTNLYCVTRASSSQTRTDSGITASTSWRALKIVRVASSVQFYVDGAPVCTHSATIPTEMLQPILSLKNTEAVAKTVDIDLFDFVGQVTR